MIHRTTLLMISFLLLLAGCKNDKTTVLTGEPTDPDSYDLTVWDKINNGLNASFASTNTAYSKSIPPTDDLFEAQKLNGWRGEDISSLLLVWSNNIADQISIVNVENSDNPSPGLIKIKTQIVNYIISDSFINGCGWRDKDTIDSHLSPDRLVVNSSFALQARETRPIWLSIKLDKECKPGLYKFTSKLVSSNDTLNLPFEVEVIDRELPDPDKWSFHLDLWQNPYAVARYHDVNLWSQEHWNLLEPLLIKLASAGQKCITTTLNDKPWGGQTFDPFGSMITWIKDNSGNWSYDYSIFDQYVNFAMNCGITKQINCYSMVPWGNRFIYYSEDSTGFVELTAKPGSTEYNELWTPFLMDFREHLRDMGWLDITTIAMDERKEEDMRKIISLVKDHVPELKITLAGNILQPEIDNELYDLSIAIGLNPDKDLVRERVASGKPTTFYTCCAKPEHPNNFTFSPPADNTYIGWFASAWGYSGFLRWAYNSWVEQPEYDSRFRTWPSGDTYFVYPGEESSVRFEKLIEGIQDFEKIRILKEELSMDPSMEAADFEKELNEFLNSLHYSQLKERPSKEYVLEGQNLLYRISTR